MATTITGDNINIIPTTTTYGTAGEIKTFSVSGTEITGGILVAPPDGFLVSNDGVVFKSTQIIGTDGTIPLTTVYIRLYEKQAVGTYSGNIALTSAGARPVFVSVPESTITKAPVIITAENKTSPIGLVNPALTFTATGLKNSDTTADLTTQPTLSTPANKRSVGGVYPIKASGAVATNYSFTYVDGKFTVTVPKLPLEALIASTNPFVQYETLKTHGKFVEENSNSYTYKDYTYKYDDNEVTFLVKTKYGVAQTVLVDTAEL